MLVDCCSACAALAGAGCLQYQLPYDWKLTQRACCCPLLPGTPVPAHVMAVMADASTKCCRFASAGRAQRSALPTTSGFLGMTACQVQQGWGSGKYKSQAQARWAQHCDTVGDDDEDAVCSSNLSCSRVSASARGAVDVAGLAGVVCAHGQPGRGCFVAMPAPEQHSFHIATLCYLMTMRPDVNHIYIDIGCRIWLALRAALGALVTANDLHPSVVEQVSVPLV